MALGGGRETVPQDLQLVSPPRQHREARRAEPGALDPLEPVRQALPGDRTEGEPAVQERRRRLGHERFVRFGPEDEVLERLPRPPLAVELEPDVPAAVSDQELGHVDTEADRDARRAGAPPVLDRFADRDSRVGRPVRRVLHGLEAEGRHDAGRTEVLDAPPEAARLVDQRLDQPARVEPVVVRRWPVDDRMQEGDASLLPPHCGRGPIGGPRRAGRPGEACRLDHRLRTGLGPRPTGPEPMLGDPVPQGIAGDSQPPRGSGHVPERLVQRLEEPRALHGSECRAEVVLRRGPIGRGRSGLDRLRKGERVGRDHRRVDQQGDPLHRVDELPDVAGPGVLEDRRHRIGCQALGRQAVFPARAGQEVLREVNDVRAPLAERRQAKGHDRKPVIEVLAEAVGAHRRQQVGVARGDDPDVDGLGAGRPEPADGAVLQDLQELRLEPIGQERDLVEEQGAVVCRLEQPGLGLARVRERPALEPEQLRLEQGIGDRRAVDVQEGVGGAPPLVMERTG
jgi:hypothetical protein